MSNLALLGERRLSKYAYPARYLYVEISRHIDNILISAACHSLGKLPFMTKSPVAVVSHIGPEQSGDRLTAPHALAALAALGQPTRLEIFRLLMRAEPEGLPAGSLADVIGCPHNTLSSHLSILARSGLVRGIRDGRSIIYRANVEGIRSLIAFLVTACCDGHPELCDLQSAIRRTSSGCAPAEKDQRRI